MACTILKEQLLSEYTTLQLGGVADYIAVVTSTEDLDNALRFAKSETATQPLILGGGSNVVCRDEGYRGLVIVNKIPGYSAVESPSGVILTVGAGENFDTVVERTVSDGYWGLENLSAIPGSVGATPIQNVGAYGVEISDRIESVTAINIATQEQKIFTNEQCQFDYRDSFFKTEVGRQWCVVFVKYRLSVESAPVLEYRDLASLNVAKVSQLDIRQHVISVRSKKFPDWNRVGTAGSFFKNPVISNEHFAELSSLYPGLPGFTAESGIKVSLGWILDKVCLLRGYKKGNVRLYEQQALVLVTDKGATAKEVEAFASEITQRVRQKTNIAIEREVLTV